MPVTQFDIVIIGGGLVGASLACALEPLDLRIAVVEAVPFRSATQPSYDDRTLALGHGSCRILDGLGVWPALESNATPIKKVIVTELGRPGRVELDPSELGVAALGNVVEARAFGAAIIERLGELESVQVFCPVEVTGLDAGSDQVRLSLSADSDAVPDTISARLVVAADGARSVIRERLGITTDQHDYGQTAVICNVTPEHHHRNRAYERFTATGPFAILPHVGDRCGLVWCVATQDASALMSLPEGEFLEAAQRRFGNELGRFVRMGRRSSYPLKLVRAQQDTGQRTVIVGNAAHAIHPVGAQGFNLGLRDVAALAEVIAERGLADPGDAAVLQCYSNWRRADHDATIAWSDGLARIYANPGSVAALVRTAGLFAHAVFPPLRRVLASRQMGYRGRVPALAMGRQPGS